MHIVEEEKNIKIRSTYQFFAFFTSDGQVDVLGLKSSSFSQFCPNIRFPNIRFGCQGLELFKVATGTIFLKNATRPVVFSRNREHAVLKSQQGPYVVKLILILTLLLRFILIVILI